MLFFSLLIAAMQVMATLAITTQESAVLTATINNLNALMQNLYNKANTILTITGYNTNVPLSSPLILNYVNQTGMSQQAMYGNFLSINFGRDSYFGLKNGATQLYTINAQYCYTQSVTMACPTAINSGAVAAPCRQIFHYAQLGLTIPGEKALKASSYNTVQRPWYTQAVSRGKLGWSSLFTFATPNPNTQVTGITISGPWYSGTTVLGVVAADVDFTILTPIFRKYIQDGLIIYAVETSTNYLAATSTGENPVTSSGSIITCFQAVNDVISGSCSFLQSSTFGSTWAPDGQYETTIAGVSYVIDLVSYTDPQTQTLAWKLISVGPGTMPTTNYVTPIENAAYYTLTDLQNRLATVQSAAYWNLFLSGAYPTAPLTNNLISRISAPQTGLTQQAFWATFSAFKSMGQALYAYTIGYQYNGTYIGYTWNTDGTYYFNYRPSDPNSGCPATGSLPGYSSNCLQKYYVNADGTPGAVFAQSQFDPRTRPWYTTAQSTGVPTWSSLYTSALSTSTIYLIGFAAPVFDPNTGLFEGNFVVPYQFNLDFTPILYRYTGSNIAYVVDLRTGYLMANNVGAPIYSTSTSTYILATASSNSVIKNSALYLTDNGLTENVEITTAYNSTTDMTIVTKYWYDSTQTFMGYLILVSLEPAVVVSTPTAQPTAVIYNSGSNNDDQNAKVAAHAATASAVLVAILLLVVVAMFFMLWSRPSVSAPPANRHVDEGVVMTPMGASAPSKSKDVEA